MTRASTKTLLRIWIAFFWRATVAGFVAGAIVGGLIGAVLAAIGAVEYVQVVSSIAGFIVGIPVSMWAFVTALSMKYEAFQIQITDTQEVGETFD